MQDHFNDFTITLKKDGAPVATFTREQIKSSIRRAGYDADVGALQLDYVAARALEQRMSDDEAPRAA